MSAFYAMALDSSLIPLADWRCAMRRFVPLFLFVIFSLPFHVHAVVTSPITTYSGGGFSGMPSVASIASAYVAQLQGDTAMQVCATVNPTTYSVNTVGTSSFSYDRRCANGSLATFSVSVTSTANSCPAGQGLKNGYCSDAVDGSGNCKAGGVENIRFPATGGYTNSPPTTWSINGCSYDTGQMSNQCAYQGVQQWCGTAISNGNSVSVGTGGALAAGGTNGSTGVGNPDDVDLACGRGKIVNNTTGATSCIASTPDKPLIEYQKTVDAAGTKVEKTTVTGDPAKPPATTEIRTPTTGSPSTVTGGGSNGGGLGYVPNCVDTECTVKIDETGTSSGTGAATADSLGTTINAKITALTTAQGNGDMSVFGIGKYVAPSDDASKLVLPFSGSDTCTNPIGTILGQSITLPVCTAISPFKTILAWMLNVLVALYAWYAWARRRAE